MSRPENEVLHALAIACLGEGVQAIVHGARLSRQFSTDPGYASLHLKSLRCLTIGVSP